MNPRRTPALLFTPPAIGQPPTAPCRMILLQRPDKRHLRVRLTDCILLTPSEGDRIPDYRNSCNVNSCGYLLLASCSNVGSTAQFYELDPFVCGWWKLRFAGVMWLPKIKQPHFISCQLPHSPWNQTPELALTPADLGASANDNRGVTSPPTRTPLSCASDNGSILTVDIIAADNQQ